MPYGLGGAILRPDLAGVVEEAFLQSTLYIGSKILPPMPVPNRAGQYPVIQKNAGNLLRNEVKVRGAGSNYARIQRAWTSDDYTAQEYGIESIVPDDNAQDLGRFFDVASFEIRRDVGQVMMAHEIRTAAKIFDTSVFTLSTSATAYTGANLATFDIGYDVDGMKQDIQSRGESVDNLTLVMSLPVFLRARQSTRLQNRTRGTVSTDTQLTLSAQAMADALEVKEVVIGRATYDTSKQGASSSSLSSIWSNTYLWLGRVEQPSGPDQYFNGGTGFTLYWDQDAAMWQVEQYREENIRSTIIRARQYTSEKIVLATGAQLLATQYS